MATNKERIEALEAGIDGVKIGMQRLEETISRLSEVMLANTESSNHNTSGRGPSRTHLKEFDGSRQIFSSKMARLEFPKYSGDDPTEWFNRVAKFFEFQSTTENQKSL